MIKKSITIILFILIISHLNLFSIDIKKESSVELNQEKLIIQRAMSIVVLKDDQYLILDYKAKNIKLYDKDGTFIKIWGKQGFGPNEFGKPSLMEYRDNLLAVGDNGKRKIFIYKDKGRNEFTLIKDFYSRSIGDWYTLHGNKLLISGSKKGKDFKDYELYLMDIETDEIDFLLFLWHKFGYESYKEYDRKYESELRAVSFNSFSDILDKHAYFVWAQRMRIIKIDLDTKKQFIFGHKTENYTQPRQTKRMRELFMKRDPKVYLEDRPFSHIIGLIADNDFIALIYANYDEKAPGWQSFMQFYTHDGTFINEKKIPGATNNDHYPLSTHYYNKDTKNFYFLSQTLDKDDNDIYHVNKYKLFRQEK
jgi:hypothetical protein